MGHPTNSIDRGVPFFFCPAWEVYIHLYPSTQSESPHVLNNASTTLIQAPRKRLGPGQSVRAFLNVSDLKEKQCFVSGEIKKGRFRLSSFKMDQWSVVLWITSLSSCGFGWKTPRTNKFQESTVAVEQVEITHSANYQRRKTGIRWNRTTFAFRVHSRLPLFDQRCLPRSLRSLQ